MQDLYRSLRTLRGHEQGIQPDPAWVSQTRNRLLMQVKNTMPTKDSAEKNRRTLAIAHPGFLAHARGPVFAVFGILVLIFGGTFASVRAAENSLPGDSLYMVKLVTEQTQIAFERSKTEKTKLKVSFTRRRIEELKKILSATGGVDNKEERVSRAVEILKQDFSTLKNQLADVENIEGGSKRDTIDAAKAVDQEVVEAVQALKDSKKENFTEEVKQKVADAEAQVADAGMHALEVMVTALGSEDVEGQVSGDEIGASLAQHATVAQETIASILLANQGATSSSAVATSSTKQGVSAQANGTSASSTNSGTIAKGAEVALDEVTALLGENRVAEAVQKLKEASAMSFLAQTEAQKELIASLLIKPEEAPEEIETTSSTESTIPSASSTEP